MGSPPGDIFPAFLACSAYRLSTLLQQNAAETVVMQEDVTGQQSGRTRREGHC